MRRSDDVPDCIIHLFTLSFTFHYAVTLRDFECGGYFDAAPTSDQVPGLHWGGGGGGGGGGGWGGGALWLFSIHVSSPNY